MDRPGSGATVLKLMARTVDLAQQRHQGHDHLRKVAPDGQVRRTLVPFALRYVWRYEAELLLENAGFAVDGLYGGWDLSPFESAASRS